MPAQRSRERVFRKRANLEGNCGTDFVKKAALGGITELCHTRTSGQNSFSAPRHRSLLLGVCILCALWIQDAEGHAHLEKRLLERRKGGDEDAAGVYVQRWPAELCSTGERRHPADGTHRSVIVGFMNEDGSFNSSYIGSDAYVCGDERWEADEDEGEEEEEAVYDGEASEAASVGRFEVERRDPRETYKFEKCAAEMRDYIPCFDQVTATDTATNDAATGQVGDRHCVEEGLRLRCIVGKPSGYKTPIKWPASKDEVWAANLPRQAGNDNWVITKKSKLKFMADRVRFPDGIDGYLDRLAEMVPGFAFGVKTRIALAVGCGIASFGAGLLARGVLPLSIDPKGQMKVQIALERGIPAMIAALTTRRLPHPSQAFDLVHCSDCEIHWTGNDGHLLIEVNRLLRAGGYFVWGAPSDNSYRPTWDEMEDLASRLCWTRVARDGRIAVWQKPNSNSCYQVRSSSAAAASPPMCDTSDDPDQVWGIALRGCISWLPTTSSGLPDWPARLSVLSDRAAGAVMDAELSRRDIFLAHQRYWNDVVARYLTGLGLHRQRVRNIMDMHAGFGCFAAALVHQRPDWWVMNVVPTDEPESLSVIFDRGLLGVAHDWCEPFDTYPRTYDVLQAVGLFTLKDKRCDFARIVLEMDRILRPGGWVLIREPKPMARRVEALARSMGWRTKMLPTDSGPFGKDKLLTCVKRR